MDNEMINEDEDVSFLDILVILLSGYVLIQLVLEACFSLDAGVKTILAYGDYFVSAVFMTDFVTRFHRAPLKLQFMQLGWIDFLSSLPTGNWLMLARYSRIFRLLRIIRALRSTQLVLKLLLRNRLRNSFLVVTTIGVIMVITCGSIMLSLEQGVKDANITSVSDALWWATTTVTTVGYGDRYPITQEGRIVAVILMITGVGLFSTFSGTIAAALLSSKRESESLDADELLREVKALRSEIKDLHKKNHRQHV